nr:GTP-binding protein [Candidatus Freyarchaeota archaeon]
MSVKKFIFKIVVVGDGAVGKTSLVKKYSENTFRDDYLPTIGSGFATKRLTIDGKEITYQIWDLGGQPQFRVVRQNFYRGSRGVVYVFDISRRETLENLGKWKEEVSEFCGSVPSILIGNKIDLPRKVETREGECYGRSFNAPYFETSVLQNTNVSEVFESIGRLMLERIESLGIPPIKEPVSSYQNNTPSSKKAIQNPYW